MTDMVICGFAATIQYVNPKAVEFEIHQAASAFPFPSDEDFQTLKRSILDHGFNATSPIIVYSGQNKIVDGRSRWTALKEIGKDDQVPVAFIDFPNDEAARRFALSQNLGRRHLTRQQRDQMMNDLVFDGFSLKEVADMFGVSESSATKITAETRELLEEDRNKKIVALVSEGKTQKEAADEVGVNAATVSRVMQKRNNSEIATDGSWLNKRPAIEPVVKPTEIDPLKLTHVEPEAKPVDEKLEKKIAKRVEAALKVERRALEKEVGGRIAAGIETFINNSVLPVYGRRIELAEQIVRSHEKGIMTKAQFRKVLSCLHPDNAQDESQKMKLASVFGMFKGFEALLIEPKLDALTPLADIIEAFNNSKKAA